jgi:hypothetical protein
VGFWAQRTPASDRTSLHRTLLAGLGVCIVLLAFYDAWLGFVAAGDDPLLWGILFVVSTVIKELSPPSVESENGNANQWHGFRRSLRCILLVWWLYSVDLDRR